MPKDPDVISVAAAARLIGCDAHRVGRHLREDEVLRDAVVVEHLHGSRIRISRPLRRWATAPTRDGLT